MAKEFVKEFPKESLVEFLKKRPNDFQRIPEK